MRRRYEPYTAKGIKRVPCPRCGAPSSQQWTICATFHAYHPICLECDIAINRMVLEFMRFPDVDKTIAAYRKRMEWRA